MKLRGLYVIRYAGIKMREMSFDQLRAINPWQVKNGDLMSAIIQLRIDLADQESWQHRSGYWSVAVSGRKLEVLW